MNDQWSSSNMETRPYIRIYSLATLRRRVRTTGAREGIALSNVSGEMYI